MAIRLIIVAFLFAIVGALGSGLYFLYRDRGAGLRTVKALSLRIALSIILFALLLIAYRVGLIPGYSQ